METHLYTAALLPAALRKPYHTFLESCGLSDEADTDYTVLLLDDEDAILACGSLRGNVLKQIAVHPTVEGAGACAQIVTELVAEAGRRGDSHLFLYTKPEHRALFASLGFSLVVETEVISMLENRKNGLEMFLNNLPHLTGTVGSVVCNCNPFTCGHRALVEYAAAHCGALLVFVLSEEASLFSAADRIALVKAGTADLDNVFVVQSREYLISRATFPTYFLKETADAEQARCDLDLLLFGIRIAPTLGITRRFVGEEPYDPVTRQYNERMKTLLPPLGVEVTEIPRFRGISASRVRQLLRDGKWRETRTLLPDTTYEYCKRRFGGAANDSQD